MYIPEIDAYNNSDNAHCHGVRHVNGYYESYYRNNGKNCYIGTFDDEIAAANAHNWFCTSTPNVSSTGILNNVPYMPPEEWFSHKYYSPSAINKPVKLYEFTNESEEERKARCLARYGVEFL